LRKSVTLFSVFLIIFIAGSGLGYGLVNPSQYERKITNLETEKADLNSQASALQAEKSSLLSRISALEQQLRIEVLGVYFSPKGGCEDQVIHWITRANVSIHILIYSFTLDSIGDASVDAHNRGVEVQVVFEETQISQYSEYQTLRVAGIAVRNDTNPYLMHDKVMIIDGVIVLTGSFNWSDSAENSNNENLIVISGTYVARIYEEEFQKIWNKSI
jgi:phosphatidylserine/phosphatidylglycerophosphate/cardiolipin synthase-like enzyme